MRSASFDPGRYKEASTREWQRVAMGWHKWMPVLSAWCGSATEQMLDLAGMGPGSRILDIAAGDGDQSLMAAQRVGPEGLVLATDINANMLALADEAAREAGLPQLTARVMDAEHMDLDVGSFDAVISRFGLMLLPNVGTALAEICRVLKPGGRIAAVVFSTPEKSPWLAVPIEIARRRAQLPPPDLRQPGLFRLGSPGVFEAALRAAGFRDIVARTVSLPFRLASVAVCMRFLQEAAGAVHEILAPLEESERRAAWIEIEAALRAYEGPEGFVSPCELIVGGGSKGESVEPMSSLRR